jgi:hypothetical protein
MRGDRIAKAWVAANPRTTLLSGAACAILLLTAPQTRAEVLQIGDVEVDLSGAATAGTEVRTTPQNPLLIFAPNGRRAGIPAVSTSGSNQDDGNLNYDQARWFRPSPRPTPLWMRIIRITASS